MQRCIALFHIGLFNTVISEDLKKFMEISKKHLTNMQFRAAILLSTLSKMALVVRSVSRHKNYKEDYL